MNQRNLERRETAMNNPPTPFGAQLIGQTEKTMNAILDRVLADRISEPEWVALVLIAGSGGSAGHDQFTARVAFALKETQETAAARVGQLAAKGLVQITPELGTSVAPEPGTSVALTETGQRLMSSIRQHVDAITQRLWGDLPAADLDVAGRVLRTVLERAEAEVAARS
jgi:DNA-binding MarR family transcriptional regulator